MPVCQSGFPPSGSAASSGMMIENDSSSSMINSTKSSSSAARSPRDVAGVILSIETPICSDTILRTRSVVKKLLLLMKSNSVRSTRMTCSRTTLLLTGRPFVAHRFNVASRCVVLSFQVRCLTRDTSRTENHTPTQHEKSARTFRIPEYRRKCNQDDTFPAEWLAITSVLAE